MLQSTCEADLKRRRKTLFSFLGVLGVGVVVMGYVGSEELLTLHNVQTWAVDSRDFARQHALGAAGAFMGVFVVTTLFLPGAALLTLLGGYLFGVLRAILYVDAATTVAAVLCFAISRNVCGSWVQRRYAAQIKTLNAHIATYGHFYLLMVRLVPMIPFFGINVAAGLTKIRMWTFTWTTALGSIPGIIVFSYAGENLLSINSVDDVFTAEVITALVLLVLLLGSVFLVRVMIRKAQARL